MRQMCFKNVVTASGKAAVPIEYNSWNSGSVDYLSSPMMERVDDNAVGTASLEEVLKWFLKA